jgi:hypothetical protein
VKVVVFHPGAEMLTAAAVVNPVPLVDTRMS